MLDNTGVFQFILGLFPASAKKSDHVSSEFLVTDLSRVGLGYARFSDFQQLFGWFTVVQ